MLVSRGRNPSAAEVLTQLVQNRELRGRVLTTLGLLLLIRLGIYIPLPGIDRQEFQSFLQQRNRDRIRCQDKVVRFALLLQVTDCPSLNR